MSLQSVHKKIRETSHMYMNKIKKQNDFHLIVFGDQLPAKISDDRFSSSVGLSFPGTCVLSF